MLRRTIPTRHDSAANSAFKPSRCGFSVVPLPPHTHLFTAEVGFTLDFFALKHFGKHSAATSSWQLPQRLKLAPSKAYRSAACISAPDLNARRQSHLDCVAESTTARHSALGTPMPCHIDRPATWHKKHFGKHTESVLPNGCFQPFFLRNRADPLSFTHLKDRY